MSLPNWREHIFVDKMVGCSQAMRDLFETIRRVSQTGESLVIFRESGCGGTLASVAIHELNKQKGKWIFCNTSAIKGERVQEELFGPHGVLSQASQGTLHLDGTTGLQDIYQKKLASELTSNRIDAQVIFSFYCTEGQLEAHLESSYYKCIQEFEWLTIPGLRERPEDIPVLTSYFLEKACIEFNKQVKIEEGVVDLLQKCDWPGNTHTIRNAIWSAVAVTEEDYISTKHLDSQTSFWCGIS